LELTGIKVLPECLPICSDTCSNSSFLTLFLPFLMFFLRSHMLISNFLVQHFINYFLTAHSLGSERGGRVRQDHPLELTKLPLFSSLPPSHQPSLVCSAVCAATWQRSLMSVKLPIDWSVFVSGWSAWGWRASYTCPKHCFAFKRTLLLENKRD